MVKKLQPLSPQQIDELMKSGRYGDTMVAHINPQEAEMLKRMGGSGTINPKTGLPEFAFGDFGPVPISGGGGGGDWYDSGGDWGDFNGGNFGGGGFEDPGLPGGGFEDPGFTSQPTYTDPISEVPGWTITDVRPTDTPMETFTISVTDMELPDIPTEAPTEVPGFTITAIRPTDTPMETFTISVTDMELPDIPTEAPTEVPGFTITAIRPTDTPMETFTISVTDMELPSLPPITTEPPITETETVSEIIITAVRPTPTPTITETFTFSFTDTLLPSLPPLPTEPPVTETETVSEIIITAIRPTETPVITETFTFSFTDTLLPSLPPLTTEPPVTETPTVTETETETITSIPPTFPPTLPPTLPPPTLPPPTMTPTMTSLVPGEMINPGWIQAQPFYNTTNAAQSKFFWGGHGPQFVSSNPAQPFDARAYNQVAAPDTPWGLGQVSAPLSPEEVQAAIEGRFTPRATTAPATRAEAYRAPTIAAPLYGQVQVGGPTAAIAPTTRPTGATKELYTAEQKTQISNALGTNWQRDLDNAALNGDYATIVRIQNQINAILNPITDAP